MIINEIFYSVSGECGEFRQGSWVVFVRLAGCNLSCSWCDTTRAQSIESGHEMSLKEILAEVQRVSSSRTNQVVLTGGEPLVHSMTRDLCLLLTDNDYVVQVETNGSICLPILPVFWVVDYKLPSSGMEDRMMDLSKFEFLPTGTWIKFVIANEQDYIRAIAVVKEIACANVNIAFSACPPGMTHAELFHRMKTDGLRDILLSVQIHKLASLKES